MKSWKIGAIAGLIAGLVMGIIYSVFVNVAVSIGLHETYWRPIITKTLEIDILINIIFGLILGVIFSKVYEVIPGKNILKGFYFGLIIFLITPFRMATSVISFGYFLFAIGLVFQGFFTWIAYGLVLGALYRFLYNRYVIEKRMRIITYDMKSGAHPGAIAGIADGLASSIVSIIGPALGLWMIPGYPKTVTFDFWMSQAGSHFLFNLIWGTIFGLIFAHVYNLVPGRGVMKGLIYSLIIYLITTFQIAVHFLGYTTVPSAWELSINSSLQLFLVGFFGTGVAYGLALGALYRKPTK